MSNRNELAKAHRAADEAARTLALVKLLPRRIGQTYTWDNGVIWTRYGDDDWRPTAHRVGDEWVPVTEEEAEMHGSYTSAHVATHAGYRLRGPWPR